MMFAVTKTVSYLLLPPACLFILMAAGFLLMRKHKAIGRLCVGSGLFLLYVLSLAPVADFLIEPLERTYPALKKPEAQGVQAIVVLSGGVQDLSRVGLEPAPSGASLERLISGIILHRATRLPLVITGGSGLPAGKAPLDADAMARTAAGLGVLRSDMLVENQSRNTLENAAEVGRLLGARKVYLVTSAFHMKRSAAMFRKKGFDVIPAPCGYMGGQTTSALSFIPRANSLQISAAAMSEYISHTWYRLHGDL